MTAAMVEIYLIREVYIEMLQDYLALLTQHTLQVSYSALVAV